MEEGNEVQTDPVRECAAQLSNAAEALERVIGKLEAQYEALNQKIDRIIATVEKLGEKEEETAEVQASVQPEAAKQRVGRKTLPATVSTLLAKSGVVEGVQVEASTLDRALGALTIEQRIAVKSELARAGMIA
jgi:hypothetical protein